MVRKNFPCDHAQIVRGLKQKILKEKECRAYEALEEIPEILKKIKEVEKEYLFSWDDIPGNDSDRLLEFLIDNLEITWAKNAEIKKSNDGKTITVAEKENSLTLRLNKTKNTVTLKTGDRKTRKKYVLKEERNKLNIYKREYKFSIDPELPVDIIRVEEKLEKDPGTGKEEKFSYYSLFFVVSTNDVPESLEDRMVFYKFYLSRVISSKRLEIVLVTSGDTQNINEKFLQDNGIGFWKLFIRKKRKLEKVFPSLSQRAQMTKEFEKSKPKNIPLFFDKYVHDAVQAIAGVKPEQFGKKYIDRKIMNKIFDLKKISYCKQLSTLMNEQLTEKGDEHEFATEVFSRLWEECVGIQYAYFLETFDPILQHVFAETREKSGRTYRDHYIHQLQVFLLGLYIIDKLYDNFAKKYKRPEISWLIISSFHDMAYPVQLYDKWSDVFFKKALGVSKEIASLELKSDFVDKSFLMVCIGYLVTRLCSSFLNEEVGGNWLAAKKDLAQFFYKYIIEKKNHGILSSISLLEKIQSPEYKDKIIRTIKISGNRVSFQNILDSIFIPSALAIALHDEKVWQELKKDGTLPILKFDDDPLSFLLIFCDNIQEWGRPSQSQIDEKRWKKFYLKDFKYDPKRGFDVTIWTPYHTKAKEFFKDKKTELGEIETFLQQPSGVKFAIRLEDKNHKGEDFEMEGPPS